MEKGIFGVNVFNMTEMKRVLPAEVFDAISKTMRDGCALSDENANILAESLKQWAINKGATHYTHWFQPMTGTTAEKHESFASPNREGSIITKFRGKELMKGEPDASSFPSGGIRATFEARGYTAWDPTSFAFIKDNTLCIPTAFFSFSGEVLDKKTPLLKSNQALNKQCMRILKLFNSDVVHCDSMIGAEQEYFLIDKSVYLKRKDLIYTGRTLLGVNPPKDQQLDDHYFGTIKPRVAKYFAELDKELNKLGIIAKTEHNEVAPAQHELAPAYTKCNTASDQNQLIMEMMKKVADRHNMYCLLHEKPFKGLNGSGKHLNWSILTDTDINLFEPGNNPQDNAQFLLFLSALIKAVDEYQDLLRVVTASAGNDKRLGANEAPPAIISVFVGSDLEKVIESITNGTKLASTIVRRMNIGVDILPQIPADTTDRNRTSPLAFTGNKFEFRSLGSAASIADSATVLNTIVAESLSQFADILENAKDFNVALNKLIVDTLKKHSRILFNGDGYSEAWKIEAKKRGLLNLKDTTEAIPHLTKEKNVQLFAKHNIFSQRELVSRQAILLEKYCKTVTIEGLTLVEMINREVIPVVEKYIGELSQIGHFKERLGFAPKYEREKIQTLINELEKTNTLTQTLAQNIKTLKGIGKEKPEDTLEISPELQEAIFCRDAIVNLMTEIRTHADILEQLCPETNWTLPSYGEILYSVN